MDDQADIRAAASAAWAAFYKVAQMNGVRVRGRGTNVDNCYFNKSLYALAATCLAEGIDAGDYIMSVLDVCTLQSRVLTPRALLDPAVVAHYRRVLKERGGRSRRRVDWDANMAALLTQVAELGGADPDAILGSSSRPFEPWFRVFGAMSPCQKILDDYGAQAMVEIRGDRELYDLLAELRPVAMRMLASKFGSPVSKEAPPTGVILTITDAALTTSK